MTTPTPALDQCTAKDIEWSYEMKWKLFLKAVTTIFLVLSTVMVITLLYCSGDEHNVMEDGEEPGLDHVDQESGSDGAGGVGKSDKKKDEDEDEQNQTVAGNEEDDDSSSTSESD